MARIDGTHAPFKRKTTLGPGPMKRQRISLAKEWECHRPRKVSAKTGEILAAKYVQVCKYVGPGKPRKPRVVKTDRAWKKAYNKKYRAWAKSKRVGTGGKRPGYRCRSTIVSKCR